MSSSLNLVDLLEASTKVTDWYTLGVYLKMPSEVLQDIERRLSREGLKRCKIELFNSWMNRYPSASWAEIAQALEKCDENTTADQIRRCHLPSSHPASATSVLQTQDVDPQVTTSVTVLLHKDKVANFRKLESSYAELTLNLKTFLDEKQVPLLSLKRYLIDLLEEDHEKLLQATTIDKLFQLISPYYCFLNTAVLGNIIDKFIGEPLKHQLEEYERQLDDFKESTSMSLLQEISPQCSPSVGLPQVTIKLAKCWQSVTIKRFQRLVEQIFEENSTALANITVKTGCICVTWLARKSAILSLVAQAQEKTELMQLVGVLRMSISEIDILEQQEDTFFFSSALYQATLAECVDAVVILLSILEADPNSSDSEGVTPLIIACHYGNIQIATLLLQACANINQQCETGATALMFACYLETPHNDLVRLLMQSGADISIKTSRLQRTALMIAAYCGHTSIVQYLLDEGAPVNTQDVNGGTSLMLASEFGHSDVVRVLINYGADVNILAKNPNTTALVLACSNQRTVCVDLLLAGGADPNLCSREHSPLSAACIIADQQMDPTILNKLLSAGANPNIQTADDGSTALMEAAAHSYEKGVEVLLNAAADVNIQNSYGGTALHYAAGWGHLAVSKMLLASGAQASLTDSYGRTALDLALNNGHHEVCELLRTSMDSDLPRTTQETVNTQPSHTAQEIDKPVQDSPRPQKAHRSNILPTIKPRRSILPSIASVGQLFKNLLLPDRAIKLRHSNQTQEPNTANI